MNHLKLLRCSILLIFSILITSSSHAEDIGKQAYGYWRVMQPNGLGFGLSLSGVNGIIFFYDRNLNEKSQIHIQTSIGWDQARNLFGLDIIKVRRALLFGTYRKFFSEDKGFYYGAGAGLGKTLLDYTSATSSYDYNAEKNGAFILGEIGWQGKENFYFHISLQPAFYFTYSDDYDENQITTDHRHRATANEMWEDAENIIQLSIGFGWFF